MIDLRNSNLCQRFPRKRCDGNVCINRSESSVFIILERLLYIELCGECQRLASLIQHIHIITDTKELMYFSNPFKKWKDITQFEFNHVIILRLLKKVLKRLNEVYDLISSNWYGLNELETGIENIICNIHLVEKNIKH